MADFVPNFVAMATGVDRSRICLASFNYVIGGCTANLCAIDLSKAFDKVNHNALLSN